LLFADHLPTIEKLDSIFIPTPTPSPEPEELLEDLPAEELSIEQIRELQRRSKESQPTAEFIRGIKREYTEDNNEDGPLRRVRRGKSTVYLVLPQNDDEEFVEVDAPVRPSQPSTQLD
jgi:hypothetical protein